MRSLQFITGIISLALSSHVSSSPIYHVRRDELLNRGLYSSSAQDAAVVTLTVTPTVAGSTVPVTMCVELQGTCDSGFHVHYHPNYFVILAAKKWDWECSCNWNWNWKSSTFSSILIILVQLSYSNFQLKFKQQSRFGFNSYYATFYVLGLQLDNVRPCLKHHLKPFHIYR
ncbi:uncharacterized protein GIQ15_00507 [Arthroderma uncinatum]|uniref:uncharacterized protein n=1 Tax=Arthroderma uncinatum TaxID=74035 RepID=UPI00144A8ABF|nr:uncharacterized protein GIQ15_00507 [Arthroderma uncinatum]KAF3490990.1 hypothetical protein GIQ15_00507 [Arthroderma uncinatum]